MSSAPQLSNLADGNVGYQLSEKEKKIFDVIVTDESLGVNRVPILNDFNSFASGQTDEGFKLMSMAEKFDEFRKSYAIQNPSIDPAIVQALDGIAAAITNVADRLSNVSGGATPLPTPGSSPAPDAGASPPIKNAGQMPEQVAEDKIREREAAIFAQGAAKGAQQAQGANMVPSNPIVSALKGVKNIFGSKSEPKAQASDVDIAQWNSSRETFDERVAEHKVNSKAYGLLNSATPPDVAQTITAEFMGSMQGLQRAAQEDGMQKAELVRKGVLDPKDAVEDMASKKKIVGKAMQEVQDSDEVKQNPEGAAKLAEENKKMMTAMENMIENIKHMIKSLLNPGKRAKNTP